MTSHVETLHQPSSLNPSEGYSKHVKSLSGSTTSGGNSLNNSRIILGRQIERSLSYETIEETPKIFHIANQSISQKQSSEISEDETAYSKIKQDAQIQTIDLFSEEEPLKEQLKKMQGVLSVLLQKQNKNDLVIEDFENLKKKSMQSDLVIESLNKKSMQSDLAVEELSKKSAQSDLVVEELKKKSVRLIQKQKKENERLLKENERLLKELESVREELNYYKSKASV